MEETKIDKTVSKRTAYESSLRKQIAKNVKCIRTASKFSLSIYSSEEVQRAKIDEILQMNEDIL